MLLGTYVFFYAAYKEKVVVLYVSRATAINLLLLSISTCESNRKKSREAL